MKPSQSIRKTVFHPELALIGRYTIIQNEELVEGQQYQQQMGSSRDYHEPRMNRIKELKDKLTIIKLHQVEKIDSLRGMTPNSRLVANREV